VTPFAGLTEPLPRRCLPLPFVMPVGAWIPAAFRSHLRAPSVLHGFWRLLPLPPAVRIPLLLLLPAAAFYAYVVLFWLLVPRFTSFAAAATFHPHTRLRYRWFTSHFATALYVYANVAACVPFCHIRRHYALTTFTAAHARYATAALPRFIHRCCLHTVAVYCRRATTLLRFCSFGRRVDVCGILDNVIAFCFCRLLLNTVERLLLGHSLVDKPFMAMVLFTFCGW